MDISATILIDNLARPPLVGEWGLSVMIEYRGTQMLLDTGASEKFADNARQLGIDLSRIQLGVLSHAHYDHSDGMPRFFLENSKASFFLRKSTEENCYSGDGEDRHYIGVKRGLLTEYRDRITYIEGKARLLDGAWLLSHTSDMYEAGKKAKMYLLCGDDWQVDLFRHEQSLVFETEKGLVIFNSCCHGGADVIIDETKEAFGGQEVYALVGGLHLFRSTDKAVREIAQRIKATGIRKIITGHCTGEHGFEVLSAELGPIAEQMYTGMTLEI